MVNAPLQQPEAALLSSAVVICILHLFNRNVHQLHRVRATPSVSRT